MRPCLNELQKEYCVKTKVIALVRAYYNEPKCKYQLLSGTG